MRHLEAYEAIRVFIEKRGRSPSLRELAKLLKRTGSRRKTISHQRASELVWELARRNLVRLITLDKGVRTIELLPIGPWHSPEKTVTLEALNRWPYDIVFSPKRPQDLVRARRTFAFVCRYIREWGVPPSIREIAVGACERSHKGVKDALSLLQGVQLIEFRHKERRGIRLLAVLSEELEKLALAGDRWEAMNSWLGSGHRERP